MLIPSTKGQKMMFIIGQGGEGKSRIAVVLREIFGDSMITGNFQRIESDRFFRYNLKDMLLMVDDDMQMSALPSTAYIKNLVTAEIPTDVEAKGKQSEQSLLYTRLLCFGNGLPKALYDKSKGFSRRMIILTTLNPPEDRVADPNIADKFIAEKDKIFCWMFDCLRRLIANNYRFIEETFPESGVRFIAIGDDVDTNRENLDLFLMLPMKNIFNQYYPADCSRKTRQAFKTKALSGEFIGTNAPYSYRKSTEDNHILEIDEVTAPIVREIFEMTAYKGYGYKKIARELSKRKILTQTTYHCQREGKAYEKDPYDWNLTSVRRILENSEYLGCVVNGRKKKLSFKSKRVISVAQDKWIVADNTHEPIISQRLWNDAHRRLGSHKRTSKTGSVNIFAGCCLKSI